MKIGIDESPLKEGNFLQHRVRGTGFYIKNLKESLLKNFPNNKYIFFSAKDKIQKELDLVHYSYFEPFFLTLPFNTSIPFVVTVHDLTPFVFPQHFPRGAKGQLKWLLQQRSLKKAKAIIADSQCSKKDIIKFVGVEDERVKVVYLAASENFSVIKNEDILNTIRLKYSLPKKFGLYVGDATWNKNLPRLIEAVRIAEIPFIMVGKAIEERNIDTKNKWNQDLIKVQKLIQETPNTKSLGFVPDDDLAAIYNLATVFVMPSLYEGFGLPVLEAMACGVPIVVSKEGSLPEIVGDAGFYVNAYDVNSISEGIKKVYESKDLQEELVQKGLRQVKNFSWKKTAEETVNVYLKVLKS